MVGTIFRSLGDVCVSSKRSFTRTTAVQTESTLQGHLQDISASQEALDNETVLVMDVTKMMCGGCSASVKKILLQHPRVEEASVNLITGTAVVKLAQGSTSLDEDDVVAAVSAKGFPSFKRGLEDSREQAEKIKLEQEMEEVSEYVQLYYSEYLPICLAI